MLRQMLIQTLTVALVGGDGAGKSTIAAMLVKCSPFAVKCLYMGASILSADKMLPTSRLAAYLKLRILRKEAESTGRPLSEPISSNTFHFGSARRGAIWVSLRLVNRIAEAWYRNILSLIYQLRGNVVIYDRHFLFDAPFPASNSQGGNSMKLVDRLEYWFFNYCYPRPDLVIFLDVPPEVLFRRKGEAGIPYLNRKRMAILERGKTMDNFVCVDANQPVEKVLADVTQHIVHFRESINHG